MNQNPKFLTAENLNYKKNLNSDLCGTVDTSLPCYCYDLILMAPGAGAPLPGSGQTAPLLSTPLSPSSSESSMQTAFPFLS